MPMNRVQFQRGLSMLEFLTPATESLWGRLKTGCVHGQRFATREQARQAVMDWIAFYNHSRRHSVLDSLSPMQFEQRWLAAQRKSAA